MLLRNMLNVVKLKTEDAACELVDRLPDIYFL